MARTQIQIEEALIQSAKNADPGVDVRKGPFRGAFIQPHAAQLNISETRVDDLSLRYSLRYVETRNPAIIDLYAFNHGLLRGDGSSSKTTVLFFATSPPPPGSSIFIPSGTGVTTEDGTVTFYTIEDKEVSSSEIEVLFNETKRRYEIDVEVESVGVGPDFEISAFRIKSLTQPIEGIAGVYQPFASSTSQQVESNQHLATRQQAKFVGTSMGTPSGIESLIRDYDPVRIQDVALVYSTDHTLFHRPTRRPAFDVYIIGSESKTQTDTFVSAGNETKFILTRQPVLGISAVTVNDLEVAWSFGRDTSPRTRDSTIAEDFLSLAVATAAGDTVVVSYTYDSLLNEIQDFILTSNKRLWQSDILLRRGRSVSLNAVLNITAMSTFDLDRVRSAAEQALYSSIHLQRFGLLYSPTAVAQVVSSTVAGLSNISFSTFQRDDALGIIPVDTVETARNEYAVLSATVTVNVYQ